MSDISKQNPIKIAKKYHKSFVYSSFTKVDLSSQRISVFNRISNSLQSFNLWGFFQCTSYFFLFHFIIIKSVFLSKEVSSFYYVHNIFATMLNYFLLQVRHVNRSDFSVDHKMESMNQCYR